MEKKFIISTTFGDFYIQAENGGIKVLSVEGYPLLSFPKVAWWDKDNIIKTLSKNEKKLLERYDYQKSIH